MGTRDFAKPVILYLSEGGMERFRAANASEALDYLKRLWSGPRTREYRRAYAICLSALDNLVSAESARTYLIAAAERAGVLYRRRRLTPATTSEAQAGAAVSAYSR
jgi:hypothetical protein